MRLSAEAELRAAEGTAGAASEAALPNCQSCGTGKLAPDRVKTALWSGESLVIVEDIPALVCQTCGEQFYQDETAMRLDMMRGAGFSRDRAARQMTVPVFTFETSSEGGGGGEER